MIRTLDPSRTPEYRAVMTVVCLACGLAAIGSVIPAVDQIVNLGMLVLGILAVLVHLARLLLRFVRERIEDAADTRTAAAWQAAHASPASARTPAGVA